MAENAERKTQVALAPQYEKLEYWLILPTQAWPGSSPKILKTPPNTQLDNQVVLRLDLLVPKTLRRNPQVIEIKLPEEIGHLARIEVEAKAPEASKA